MHHSIRLLTCKSLRNGILPSQSWAASRASTRHCARQTPLMSQSRLAATGQSQVLEVGKFKGLSYSECWAQQPEYCRWLLSRSEKMGEDYRSFIDFLKAQDGIESADGGDDASTGSGFASYGQGTGRDPNISTWQPRDSAPHPTGHAVSGSSILSFGKHRGRTFQEVLSEHPDYGEWMLKKADSKSSEDDRPPSENMQAFVDFVRGTGKSTPVRAYTPARHEYDSHPGHELSSGKWNIKFGSKHPGRSFEEVYAADRNYCEFMTSQVLSSDKGSSKDVLAFVIYVLHRKAQEQH